MYISSQLVILYKINECMCIMILHARVLIHIAGRTAHSFKYARGERPSTARLNSDCHFHVTLLTLSAFFKGSTYKIQVPTSPYRAFF